MTADDPGRCVGVADQVLVTLEGGPDQTTPPARDVMGRFQPGTSGNPVGRPYGSHNSTTIEAAKMLRAEAKRAVARLARALDDPNSFVALAAARTIIEKTVKADLDEANSEWLEYATHEEAEQVLAIMHRCVARMPISDERQPEDAGLIDVPPEPDPRDRFNIRTLPAPHEPPVEPAPPPEDDGEEFGP